MLSAFHCLIYVRKRGEIVPTRLTRKITIRVSDKEGAYLEGEASSLGLSLSDYIRQKTLIPDAKQEARTASGLNPNELQLLWHMFAELAATRALSADVLAKTQPDAVKKIYEMARNLADERFAQLGLR